MKKQTKNKLFIGLVAGNNTQQRMSSRFFEKKDSTKLKLQYNKIQA